MAKKRKAKKKAKTVADLLNVNPDGTAKEKVKKTKDTVKSEVKFTVQERLLLENSIREINKLGGVISDINQRIDRIVTALDKSKSVRGL